jgi:hypothetical protein
LVTTFFALVPLVASSMNNPVVAMSAFGALKTLWPPDSLKGLLTFLLRSKGLQKLLKRKTRLELDSIHSHEAS